MDVTELKHQIYQLNKEEEFYKEQYEAREAGQIHAYIARQNIKEVIRRHLLIPEVKETVPPEFLDSFFFDMTDKDSLVVQKHNRYSLSYFFRTCLYLRREMFPGNIRTDTSYENRRFLCRSTWR